MSGRELLLAGSPCILDSSVLVPLLQHSSISQNQQLVCKLLCTCNKQIRAAISLHLRGAVPVQFKPHTVGAVVAFAKWLRHYAALALSIDLDLGVLVGLQRYYPGMADMSMHRITVGLRAAQVLGSAALAADTDIDNSDSAQHGRGHRREDRELRDGQQHAAADVPIADDEHQQLQQLRCLHLQSYNAPTLTPALLECLPKSCLTRLVAGWFIRPALAAPSVSRREISDHLSQLTALRHLSLYGPAADAALLCAGAFQQLTSVSLGAVRNSSVQHLQHLPVSLKCLRFGLIEDWPPQQGQPVFLQQQGPPQDQVQGQPAAVAAADAAAGPQQQLLQLQDGGAAAAGEQAAVAVHLQPQQQEVNAGAQDPAVPAQPQGLLVNQLPELVQLQQPVELPTQTPITHLTALTELGSLHRDLAFADEPSMPRNLQVLDVADFTPAKPLCDLVYLRVLKLHDSTLPAAELSMIASSCSQLSHVELGYCNGWMLAGSAAPAWHSLPIRSLSVYGDFTEVDSDIMHHMARLTGLTSLHLSGGFLPDETMSQLPAAIRQLTALQTLSLAQLTPTIAGGPVIPLGTWDPLCAAIASLPSLCSLECHKICSMFESEGEKLAASIGKLTFLQLQDCNLNEFALVSIASASAYKGLQKLVVGKNLDLKDVVCPVIAGLSQLTYLDMSTTDITGWGVKALCKATNLKHLALSNTLGPDDHVLRIIAQQLTDLTHLALSYTQVSNTGLEVLSTLGKLDSLSVVGNKVNVEAKLKALRRSPAALTAGLDPVEATCWLTSGRHARAHMVDDMEVTDNEHHVSSGDNTDNGDDVSSSESELSDVNSAGEVNVSDSWSMGSGNGGDGWETSESEVEGD